MARVDEKNVCWGHYMARSEQEAAGSLRAHGLERNEGESLEAWRDRCFTFFKNARVRKFGRAA
jgi:hypothetical protein